MVFIHISSLAQEKYIVNSIEDLEDIDLADQFCEDKNGDCTFRAAIQNANKTSIKDRIEFAIPGCGPFTIKLKESLPEIIQPVVIDATTQAGYSINALKIIISGEALPQPPFPHVKVLNKGLNFQGNSGGSTLKGIVFNSFKGFGVFISTNDNKIQSNYFGIGVDGQTILGNNCAIYVSGIRNQIGGYCSGERNIISGNNMGIMLYSKNNIIGNYIGTNNEGNMPVGNKTGIGMAYHTVDTEITSNLISGNEVGLSCQGENNIITKNYIGSDITGTISIKNDIGLRIISRSGNLIGNKNAGNLISGNDIGVWVYFRTPEIQKNVFLGNYIGVDKDGVNPLPNNVGIRLDTGGENLIGGSGEGEQNIISGNCLAGIEIKNSFGNQIINNLIGTNALATHAIPNGRGIHITNITSGTNHGNNQIENNIIAGNIKGGIYIENSFLNTIRRNFLGYSPRSKEILYNHPYDIRGALADNCIGSTDPFLDNILPFKFFPILPLE